MRGLSALALDVKGGFRQLRQKPGLALVVVLTLGPAIGLGSSLLTIFNTTMLRMWPVKDADRVVRVLDVKPGGAAGFSFAESRHLSAARNMAGLATFHHFRMGALMDGWQVTYNPVSASYFGVLQVDMARGRGFRPGEDSWDEPAQVAVISHDLWRNTFGGDGSIVGRTVQMKEGAADRPVSFTIIGVAPPGFYGTPVRVDLWLPQSVRAVWSRAAGKAYSTAPRYTHAMAGRLSRGASREQAQAEVQVLSDHFRAAHGLPRATVRLTDTSTLRSGAKYVARWMRDFLLLCVAVALILALACANAGNVLLARAEARRREIAVRLALGASRAQIIRQLLTESIVLAAAAGIVGIAFAYVLPRLTLGSVPSMAHLQWTPDGRVLALTVALASMACLAAGLAPALHVTRASVSQALCSGPRWIARGFALREALLAVQVAACVILLIAAAMLARAVPLGTTRGLEFAADEIQVARIELPAGVDVVQRRAFGRQLLDALAEDPYAGTTAATFLSDLHGGVGVTFRLPGDPAERHRTAMGHHVSITYFDLFRARIVAGRNLRSTDAPDRVVVVNEALARLTWPGRTPIGETLIAQKQTLEVVGVVRDANVRDTAGVSPAVYRPLEPELLWCVLVRDAHKGLTSRLSALVTRIDPRAHTTITPLADRLSGRDKTLRAGMKAAVGLGAGALILAACGLFGVFVNAVQERTREIAIRMAIGARPLDVFRAAFTTTGRALTAGLGLGTFGAVLGGWLLRHSLHGLGAVDPVAYVGVAVTLALAGVAATCVPARRALRVDPAAALRRE